MSRATLEHYQKVANWTIVRDDWWLTLFIQSFSVLCTCYIILFGLWVKLFIPNQVSPLVSPAHYPKTNLPQVSLFFSTVVFQLHGPIPIVRQIPANLVSSFYSCKRIVREYLTISSVVLPTLIVLVLVAVPPGFRVSNLLRLLLADCLVLQGRGGFYWITLISSTTAGP